MTGRRASSSPRHVGRHRMDNDERDQALAYAALFLGGVIFWATIVWMFVLL